MGNYLSSTISTLALLDQPIEGLLSLPEKEHNPGTNDGSRAETFYTKPLLGPPFSSLFHPLFISVSFSLSPLSFFPVLQQNILCGIFTGWESVEWFSFTIDCYVCIKKESWRVREILRDKGKPRSLLKFFIDALWSTDNDDTTRDSSASFVELLSCDCW